MSVEGQADKLEEGTSLSVGVLWLPLQRVVGTAVLAICRLLLRRLLYFVSIKEVLLFIIILLCSFRAGLLLLLGDLLEAVKLESEVVLATNQL